MGYSIKLQVLLIMKNSKLKAINGIFYQICITLSLTPPNHLSSEKTNFLYINKFTASEHAEQINLK